MSCRKVGSQMAIEVKAVEGLFVKMWNEGSSKSKIILALYDEGLTVKEVNAVFQKYGVKMIYNHVYNVVSKARPGPVRTDKQDAGTRTKLTVK